MRLDPAGLPFIGGALTVAVVLALAATWLLALPFVILAGFFTFFFRDPNRVVAAAADVVVSPADGRVLVAGPAVGEPVDPCGLRPDDLLPARRHPVGGRGGGRGRDLSRRGLVAVRGWPLVLLGLAGLVGP